MEAQLAYFGKYCIDLNKGGRGGKFGLIIEGKY